MKLTIYNPKNRNQQYTIRYRPSYDQVIEGKFTISDEWGDEITLPEESLYDELRNIFIIEVGKELVAKKLLPNESASKARKN